MSEELARPPREDRVVELLYIQLVGTFAIFILHAFGRIIYAERNLVYFGLLLFLAVVMSLAIVLIGLCDSTKGRIVSHVRSAIKKRYPDRIFSPGDRLRIVSIVFLAADFLGLTLLILYFGGSEKSPYVPILFSIVPTLIIVKAEFSVVEILLISLISVEIFALNLWDWPQQICPLMRPFDPIYPSLHKVLMIFTTALSFAFPIAVELLDRLSGTESAPSARAGATSTNS